MKYCTKCGKTLNDDDIFCPKCGTEQKVIDEETKITKKEFIPTIKNSILIFIVYLLFYAIIFINFKSVNKTMGILIVLLESFAILPLFIFRMIKGKIYNRKKEFIVHLVFAIIIHIFAIIFSIIVLTV